MNCYREFENQAIPLTPDAIRTLLRNKKALLQPTEVFFEPDVDLMRV